MSRSIAVRYIRLKLREKGYKKATDIPTIWMGKDIPRNQIIMQRVVFDGIPVAKVAAWAGLSRSRVSQLVTVMARRAKVRFTDEDTWAKARG